MVKPAKRVARKFTRKMNRVLHASSGTNTALRRASVSSRRVQLEGGPSNGNVEGLLAPVPLPSDHHFHTRREKLLRMQIRKRERRTQAVKAGTKTRKPDQLDLDSVSKSKDLSKTEDSSAVKVVYGQSSKRGALNRNIAVRSGIGERRVTRKKRLLKHATARSERLRRDGGIVKDTGRLKAAGNLKQRLAKKRKENENKKKRSSALPNFSSMNKQQILIAEMKHFDQLMQNNDGESAQEGHNLPNNNQNDIFATINQHLDQTLHRSNNNKEGATGELENPVCKGAMNFKPLCISKKSPTTIRDKFQALKVLPKIGRTQ